MANPQPEDAHIIIAHSINEAVMLRDFTKRQRKVLDLILRLSWGCGKKSAIIPKQNSFEIVGVGEGHVKAELSWLVESKVIFINNQEYSFNKDFDQWQISRVKPYAPEKLTELVSLNLSEVTETVSSDTSKLTEMVSSTPLELTKTVSLLTKTVSSDGDKPAENLPKQEVLETTPIILNKDNIYILSIFNFWNQQKITVHRKLLTDTETSIKSSLKNFTVEEIQNAITNYAEIINHPDMYWFNYRWTLKDFLKRGLEKFLNADSAKQNYSKQHNIVNSKFNGNTPSGVGTKTQRPPNRYEDN